MMELFPKEISQYTYITMHSLLYLYLHKYISIYHNTKVIITYKKVSEVHLEGLGLNSTTY